MDVIWRKPVSDNAVSVIHVGGTSQLGEMRYLECRVGFESRLVGQ